MYRLGVDEERITKSGIIMKNFDLKRSLINDVPKYKERLLWIDFPEYLDFTYENVLNFFRDVYGFRMTWEYKTYEYYGEEESEWMWNVRNKNTGESERDEWIFADPDMKFKFITEDEEQLAILSIIDYVLEKIENLEF